MSLLAVARKDFEDAIRSRWLLGLTLLFVLLFAGTSYIFRPAPGETLEANTILSLFGQLFVGTLVPLLGLVVGYNAVSGERESGSLKLLLSLPHSRLEVVFGKVIGRAAALGAGILVGFVLPAVVLAIGPLEFDPAAYVGYTLLVVVFAAIFVSIGVGFSAAATTQRRALAGAIGLYFLFVPLWNAATGGFLLLFAQFPDWFPLERAGEAAELANPSTAFQLVTDGFLAGSLFAGETASLQVSAAAMLVVWLLTPPLLGALKFEREDL
ncbi:MAG: ABC transporter permease subunit [Haloferacaceae archaeon]